MENFITILQNSKVNDRQEFLNHLKKKGQIRLLEAGKDQRIYQFISHTGLRMKIRLDLNGGIEVLP